MSGHSKWATIKRKKGAADVERGQAFTKLGRAITIAAREGGGDPEMNFKLRLVLDKARAVNMPNETIKRAIERGAGSGEGKSAVEKVEYEIFGPAGVALVVEVLTDNKNRAISEIRALLAKMGGRMGDKGSARWMFATKGVVALPLNKLKGLTKDDLELELIDWGAEEILEEGGDLVIYTEVADLDKIKKALEEKGLEIKEADIELKAKEVLKIEDKQILKSVGALRGALLNLDEVNNVYLNI